MRVACTLRHLRGDRSLSDITRATDAAGVKVSGGHLSEIERGLRFPTDTQLSTLEQVYGAPVSDWYDARVLLVLQPDGDT